MSYGRLSVDTLCLLIDFSSLRLVAAKTTKIPID